MSSCCSGTTRKKKATRCHEIFPTVTRSCSTSALTGENYSHGSLLINRQKPRNRGPAKTLAHLSPSQEFQRPCSNWAGPKAGPILLKAAVTSSSRRSSPNESRVPPEVQRHVSLETAEADPTGWVIRRPTTSSSGHPPPSSEPLGD
jgi:hypothetical protein